MTDHQQVTPFFTFSLNVFHCILQLYLMNSLIDIVWSHHSYCQIMNLGYILFSHSKGFNINCFLFILHSVAIVTETVDVMVMVVMSP